MKTKSSTFEVLLSSFSSRCLCTLHVSIQYTYYIYIQYISHSPKLWMSFTLVLKRKQIQKKAQTPIFLNKRSSVIIHPWRFSGFRTNLPQHLPIFPILAGWQGVARDWMEGEGRYPSPSRQFFRMEDVFFCLLFSWVVYKNSETQCMVYSQIGWLTMFITFFNSRLQKRRNHRRRRCSVFWY